jgi:SAM-dependent methyltransferase
MTMREPDDWDDLQVAEIYAETVARTLLYRSLGGRLLDMLGPAPRERVLDLATGTGLLCAQICARGSPGTVVVGVDRAGAMLEVARREVRSEAVEFVEADPATLPFAPGSFHGCCCSAALWHFPALLASFRQIACVLRAGGRLAFNVPAAQLADLEDAAPSPFQRALASEGERLLGLPPAPSGPRLSRLALVALAEEAGLSFSRAEVFEIAIPQRDLIELLDVPAISARMYPDAHPARLRQCIDSAVSRVTPEQMVTVRWWQVLLLRESERIGR